MVKQKQEELGVFHLIDFPVLLRKEFVAQASYENKTAPELLEQVIRDYLNKVKK